MLRCFDHLGFRTGRGAKRRRPPSHRPPSHRLLAEPLESRVLLDSSGLVFGNAPFLTLSFAPDGTDVSGNPSQAFATFSELPSTERWADWRDAVLAGFQTWTMHTNADVGVVPDEGQPLGTPGASVDDPRFGDIRIAAAPLDAAIAAVAVSYDEPVAGTWVGDVVFNSQFGYQSLGELHAVAVHEAGHVFGMGHSTDPLSPMFDHGVSASTQLQPDDIHQLQSLYGTRGPDGNEEDEANDTTDEATRIRFAQESEVFDGSTPGLLYGDISDVGDVDLFELNILDGYSGDVRFEVRTAGISLLRSRVTIYDDGWDEVAAAVGTGNQGETLVLTVPNVGDMDRLFVRVEGADVSPFGVGGFSLLTVYEDALNVALDDAREAADGRFRLYSADTLRKLYESGEFEPPLLDADDTDDDPLFAPRLKTATGFQRDTKYVKQSSIESETDVDFFEFTTPEAPETGPLVATVHVRSLQAGGVIPHVTLLDRDENPLQTTVLVHGGGDVVLQAVGVQPEKNHLLRVSATAGLTGAPTGNYELTVSMGNRPSAMQVLAEGQLTSEIAQQEARLHVARDQFFHFVLDSALDGSGTSDQIALATTISDMSGKKVFQMGQRPGTSRSGQIVRLSPGSYEVRIEQLTVGGTSPLPIDFKLRSFAISDPLSVPVDDPTADPEFQCNDVVGAFCYPGQEPTTEPFLFTGVVPSPDGTTTFTNTEVSTLFLGDWWNWLQSQQSVDPDMGVMSDAYQVIDGAALHVSAHEGVLANDTAVAPTAYLLAGPSHGNLLFLPDGGFDYVPTPGFVGSDSFVYVASDGGVGAGYASVELQVVARTPGDANLDGRVDGTDLTAWLEHRFLTTGEQWAAGDFNADGTVDGKDFLVWWSHRFSTTDSSTTALRIPVSRPPRAPAGLAAVQDRLPEGQLSMARFEVSPYAVSDAIQRSRVPGEAATDRRGWSDVVDASMAELATAVAPERRAITDSSMKSRPLLTRFSDYSAILLRTDESRTTAVPRISAGVVHEDFLPGFDDLRVPEMCRSGYPDA